VKGERKFHYQIADNLFLQASINLSRLNEGNLQIAERHLEATVRRMQEATGEEKERLRLICQRLIEMREFYRHLLRRTWTPICKSTGRKRAGCLARGLGSPLQRAVSTTRPDKSRWENAARPGGGSLHSNCGRFL